MIQIDARTARRVQAALRMLTEYPSRIHSHIALSSLVIDSSIDRKAAIDSHVRFYRSSLGRYSYVGRNSFVESSVIGSFCSISSDCFIGGAEHPLDLPSTSPVFCGKDNILGTSFASAGYCPTKTTHIGNDVWIGQGVKIKGGVTVATGAVIGMGSVLTKDVGPYEIWAGNPARLIRKRFDEQTINELLSSCWWDWDEDTIQRESAFFESRVIGEAFK